MSAGVSSHPRFALLVRTLLREPGANQAARLLSKTMVARRWFPGFCSDFHWQPGQMRKNSLRRGVAGQAVPLEKAAPNLYSLKFFSDFFITASAKDLA